MPQTTEQLLKAIHQKLEVLVNLSAYGAVKGQSTAEGAPVLKRLGLTASEIAEVFGSTANAVSVRLAEASKKAKKAKKKPA
jgi:predicted transcriptional regulator